MAVARQDSTGRKKGLLELAGPWVVRNLSTRWSRVSLSWI